MNVLKATTKVSNDYHLGIYLAIRSLNTFPRPMFEQLYKDYLSACTLLDIVPQNREDFYRTHRKGTALIYYTYDTYKAHINLVSLRALITTLKSQLDVADEVLWDTYLGICETYHIRVYSRDTYEGICKSIKESRLAVLNKKSDKKYGRKEGKS